jgi:hypothetical protein
MSYWLWIVFALLGAAGAMLITDLITARSREVSRNLRRRSR